MEKYYTLRNTADLWKYYAAILHAGRCYDRRQGAWLQSPCRTRLCRLACMVYDFDYQRNYNGILYQRISGKGQTK